MKTFLWILLFVDHVFMLMTMALSLRKYELTPFALRQRLEPLTGESGKLWRSFYKLLPQVKVFMWAKMAALLGLSVALFSYLLHPFVGLVVAVVSYLVLRIIARIPAVKRFSHKTFETNLSIVVGFVQPLGPLWSLLGEEKNESTLSLGSKEEFLDYLRRLPSSVLSQTQRHRLETVILSEEKTVKQIMTPKKRVITVTPSSTLGPVLLSDLQKSGHAYFPVTTKKGQPEGVLRLIDISDINLAKQHTKASEIMSHHMSWVDESATLMECVQVSLREKQHTLLVRNEEGYTGIVTTADITKHVLGISQE